MTEICTLIAVVAIPAVACIPAQTCSPPNSDGRSLCRPSLAAGDFSCGKLPAPRYECKRSDGSTYIWTDEAK